MCHYKYVCRDTVATIIVGLIIALIFKFNVLYTIISVCIVSILAHRMFCIRTTADKILFP